MRRINWSRWMLLLALGVVCVADMRAAETSKQIAGWLRDGRNTYAEASPPTTWQHVDKTLLGLRHQARRPAPDATGKPLPANGSISEWLVLGPINVDVLKTAMEQEFVPKESELQPDDGEKSGGLAWKALPSDGHILTCFGPIFDFDKAQIFFACTYLFSPEPRTINMRFRGDYSGPGFLSTGWLNGKPMVTNTHVPLALVKGWNRIVLKFTKKAQQTFMFNVTLQPARDGAHEYDNRSIRWSRPLPFCSSAPIVVGDKLFVTIDPHYLVCLNRRDGSFVWARPSGYFESATDEERKAHPEFAEMAPLAKRLDEIIEALYFKAPPPAAEVAALKKEVAEVQRQLKALLFKVDHVRYTPTPEQDAGYAGATPCTDGKFIYVWMATGVTACYDLDGNRKWIRVDNAGRYHHGYGCSPLLADGKLVVYMQHILGIDCATGQLDWTCKRDLKNGLQYGSPAIGKIGATTIVVANWGNLVLRLSDGKALFEGPYSTEMTAPTPVVADGIAYLLPHATPLKRLQLPAEVTGDSIVAKDLPPIDMNPTQFAPFHMNRHCYTATPLILDGLMYCLDIEGDLTVVDTKEGKVVYQKRLALDVLFMHLSYIVMGGAHVSITSAGKYIYILGNTGTMIILQPGREYKEVSRNYMKHLALLTDWNTRYESFCIVPVFDGADMFLRGEENLYCISEK